MTQTNDIPPVIEWYQINEELYISLDDRWKIVGDFGFEEDGRGWCVRKWTICYSKYAYPNWDAIEESLSSGEAKAAVLRLMKTGKFECTDDLNDE